MDIEAKKVAAVNAAVLQYLEAERAEHSGPPAGPSPLSLSIWSLSGRQAIMSNRSLVCARLWK